MDQHQSDFNTGKEKPTGAESLQKKNAAAEPLQDHSPVTEQASQAKEKKPFNSYKRSTIRQYSSTLSLFILVPVFALLTLFIWVFPRSTKSEIENRNLDSFPQWNAADYFSGKYTASINHWFTDTVPFRDAFKNAGNSFKGMFGISSENTVNVKDVKGKAKEPPKSRNKNTTVQTSSTPEASQTEQSQKEESQQPVPQKDYRALDADYNIENGVVVVQQDGHYRAMELFGGGTGDAYVDSLNALRSRLDSSIKMYSMIDPLPCEFYLPANFSENNASQKAYFEDIADRLDNGIVSVDALSALALHTEEPIYCRTDHHWMPLGAYYAAEAFAKTAQVDFKPLTTFKPVTIKDFVGTMYGFSGDINIKNDPEDFTYYIPDNYDQCKTDFYDTAFDFDYTGSFFKEVGDPQSNAYLTFFGGDEQIVKVRTNVKNGRKLLEVKDSYGNALPGYLMNSFEEIYIVDMRYFQCNLVDFIQQMGVTDVLFSMATFSAFGDNSYGLPELMNQAQGMTIVDHYNDGE